MIRVIIRAFQKLRVFKYQLLSNVKNVRGKANFIQPTLLHGNGNIIFGEDVYLGTEQSPYFYSGYCFINARENTAQIVFGDRVWSNNNLTIISQDAGVVIGSDTIIGSNVEIYDSDFHDPHTLRRKTGKPLSIKVDIGQNVWIGSNVKILKGVKIGANSIIGNNSVVTKHIPENSIWGGVPAKFLKNLNDV
jgi:galactoside O-acetyltransferase